MPGTSETSEINRPTKVCDKSKSKGSENGLKETVLTMSERFKRKTKTCAKSANKAIHATVFTEADSTIGHSQTDLASMPRCYSR